jgi:hemolysin activation/secretion protein
MHAESEGPRYWVSRFALEYAEPHAAQPSLEWLAAQPYALGQGEDGYVGPRRGGRNHWFRLDEMGEQSPVPVYASGLRELAEQIVRDLNSRGLIGVYVAPHPDDIDPATGEDRRPADVTALRLRVHTGRVKAVRTFAADPSLDNAERVDRPRHRWIAERSPIRPQPRAGAGGDLLDRKRLDEYVARLNRYPGRQVDVVLTPTLEPGRINVDYVVEEERPWSFYSSLSDTGTDRTGDWRQRFGFTRQQLFGLDDALRLDYVTDGFDDIHAFFGSYEGLMPDALGGRWFEGLRWRVGGASTEYEAKVPFGIAAGDGGSTKEIFAGKTRQLELGLAQTVYQNQSLFVDVGAGVRWMQIDTTNLTVLDARSRVLVPGITLQIENRGPGSQRYANLALESGRGSGFDDLEEAGGRVALDDRWLALRWDAGLRFSPGVRSWRRSPGASELRHELQLSTEGQYAFDDRILPHEQGVLGGLYTVRGYPQSVVSGDSIFIARAEYRYHWPLGLSPNGFLGSDWDLILKGFLDLGYARSHEGSYMGRCQVGADDEDNDIFQPCSLDTPDSGTESLASVGVGFELMLRRNLSLRLDYGIALTELEDERTERGDTETHLSAVVRY